MAAMRRNRGFTLLEVMATLAVVAVALTVLLVERNLAVKRTARTNDRRIALQIAEEKAGEILLGLETAAFGNDEKFPAFRWAAEEGVEAVEVEGEEAGALRRVSVTVTFPLGAGEDRVTLVAAARGQGP